jgi:iron complex outermembrane recepter protein
VVKIVRSLHYLIWFGLFGLLVAPTALAESRSPLAPLEKRGTRMKVPLDKGETALKVPLKKGDLGGSLAQNSQLTRVTGVEVKQTPAGVQVILKTPPGQPKLVPLILPEGNNLVIDLLDATLAFSIRNGVTQTNPAPGIKEVRVSKIDATSVRVTIAGEQQAPSAEVVPSRQNLVLNVNPKATAQTQADEEIEIVVTGEREEDNYAVPNSNVGTRTDAEIKDVPQSIQVVPRQVIEDQGATDIEDVLRNVSGVAQQGGDASRQTNIRGLGEEINALRDGAAGFNSPAQIDLDLSNVEQVEVLKGPSSVLYGSGEPGGIVNLVTKKPLENPLYEVTGTIGNFDRYRSSIDLTGPLNNKKTVLYRLNASYGNEGSFIDFVESEEFAIFPVLSFKLGKNTTLELTGRYEDQSEILGGSLPNVGTILPNPLGQIPNNRFLGEPNFNRFSTSLGEVGYHLEHRFSDRWSLSNRFRASFSTSNFRNVFLEELEEDNRTVIRTANRGRSRGEDYNLQIDVNGKVKTGIVNHDLLAGLELGRGIFNSRFIGVGNVPSIDLFEPEYGNFEPVEDPASEDNTEISNSFGVFAQNLLSIGEKVKILAGGRFDVEFDGVFKDNLTGESETTDSASGFAPRVGIVYQPTEPVSLYTGWSRSFLPQSGTDREGNPFVPITGDQFEVGVKNEFFDGKLSTTLAAYQITRQNDFLPDPVDPDNFQNMNCKKDL